MVSLLVSIPDRVLGIFRRPLLLWLNPADCDGLVSIPDRVLGIFRHYRVGFFALAIVVSIPDRVLGIFRPEIAAITNLDVPFQSLIGF